MSRKCTRLCNFLCCFGDFIIDFIAQHNNNSNINRRLLLSHFQSVASRAANDHFHEWKLNQSQLWERLTCRIRRCIPQRPLGSWKIRLIRSVIDSAFNTPKRRRSSPHPPETIPGAPLQVTNVKPLKRQRLNTQHQVPTVIIPNVNSNNAEPLICRSPKSYPLDTNPTTPSLKPVDDAALPQQEISQPTSVICNSPTDCSNNDTDISVTPLHYSNHDAACESEDLDSKLDVLPSPTPTPQ